MSILYIPDSSDVYRKPSLGTAAALNMFADQPLATLSEESFRVIESSSKEYGRVVNECAKYSAILLHSRYMFWGVVLRRSGILARLLVVPDYNYFDLSSLFGLFAASLVRRDGDIFFCGSRASSYGFELAGFRSVGLYPIGVDYKFFAQGLRMEKSLARTRTGVDGNSVFLVYAGRLAPDRRLVPFLRRLSDSVNTRWRSRLRLSLLYRNKNDEYFDEVSEFASKLCLEFIQDPSPSQIRTYLRAADFKVIPGLSEHETFCRAVFEAMAAGTPCIVPNAGPFVEYVPESVGLRYHVDPRGCISEASEWGRILDLIDSWPRPSYSEISRHSSRFDMENAALAFFESLDSPHELEPLSLSPVLAGMFSEYEGDLSLLETAYFSSTIKYDAQYLEQWRADLWARLLRPRTQMH